MNDKDLPEYWLRGKIEGYPVLLQPIVHSLLQSKLELKKYMLDFPDSLLWEKPVYRASVGFHLQHLTGVLDRLFTYVEAENLTDAQLTYLKNETVPNTKISSEDLIELFNKKIEEQLEKLKTIPVANLTEFRGVGRKQLPSSVIGLMFHAAEHTQRHIGQLLVTVSVVKAAS
ncbi:DinB family protein [Gillisia sp. CAL575]|uniref:DinB family protein n=1 Tax=Gillisia sp. CAL575 TaxID=985255 RepID=UPI00039D92EF|nr:DinB family protein [Gillisia sp. CAL575]